MMNSYPGLTKLKTKPILYQNAFLACDPATFEELKEVTVARKAVEDSINDNTHLTEAIAREMSGGSTSRCEQDIRKLERYLPLLENLICNIDMKVKNQQTNRSISDLKIRWSSVLTSSCVFDHLKSVKFHQVNDVYFELGMTLFLYGAMLRERAFEVLSSDLVQAATLFRKAGGVYDYLAQVVLVRLIRTKDTTPETAPQISFVMSLVCLADAQAASARKAEEKGSSTSLLAKLHHGIILFLVEAIETLRNVSKESINISSRLLDFILSCKMIHELRYYKYKAESLKDGGEIGAAIAVLRLALSNAKKAMPKEESWKSVFKQVADDLSVILKKYEHENEFVWYEKVPYNKYDLPLPQGVKIVSLIPYQPSKLERPLDFKL